MSKRCVYLSSDAEWSVMRLQRLALEHGIEGLSVSAILAAGLEALNDNGQERTLEYLRYALRCRWAK